MKFTELNQGSIGSLLEKYGLDKVKTYTPTTLFDLPIDWDKVKQKRCGVCGNKLKVPVGGKIAYCSGKRHPDKRKFMVSLEKLQKLIHTQ